MWRAVFSLQNECNFDGQLRATTMARLPHDDGGPCAPLFSLRTDGKAHVLLARGDGFAKLSPGAMVCHCYGKNLETDLQQFGGAEVTNAGF